MKKLLKVLGFVFGGVYLAVILFVIVCLLNYNDYKVSAFKTKTYLIADDTSLEPDFAKGSFLVVNKDSVKNLEKGDFVFFYDTESKENVIGYSEVYELEKITDSETTVTLENNFQLSSEYIIGTKDNTKSYSCIGSILGFLESKWGFLLTVILPVLVLFIYEIYIIVCEVKKDVKTSTKKDNEDDEEEKPVKENKTNKKTKKASSK